MNMDMSPRPKREPMIRCKNCGRDNDPGRGSKNCWYCSQPLSQATGSELRVFNVEGSGMRFGVAEDGRPYVVAEDFTPSLNYSRARDALRMVDDDEKGAQIVRTPGGPQQMAVLYEDGLWELIFLSRKPEAKAIKKRVKAILREIRETGSYSLDRRKLPQDYSAALRALADEHDAHQITRQQRDDAEHRAAELAAPAAAWDTLASGHGDFSVADAAKILTRDPSISIGRDRLFDALADMRWLYRAQGDGRWRAYQTQVDAGRLSELPQQYENKRTGQIALAAPQVRITVKGLAELHRRLGGSAPLAIEDGE